jgi:hypothetical protein
MVHIHSEDMVVNISVQKNDGIFENYAGGEAGVRNLRVLQSFVIFLPGIMILVQREKIF